MTLSEAQADDILKQLLLMARAQVAAKVELHGWKLEYKLRNNPGKAVGDWSATCPAGENFRSFIRLKEHMTSPPEPPPPCLPSQLDRPCSITRIARDVTRV